jgi:uncharacterized protein (TIGR00255 family)
MAVTVARFNPTVALAYAVEIQKLSQLVGPGVSPMSMEALLRLPGVVEAPADSPEATTCAPLLEGALRAALEQLDQMRRREGEALEADLVQRVTLIREAVERVSLLAPGVVVRYREALLQRIAAAGIPGLVASDERLLKEVFMYADRSDISEELARLRSHFLQFEDCRIAKDAVGRKLDFLAQEMNREINTIGSKANDAGIAAEVANKRRTSSDGARGTIDAGRLKG